MTTGFADASYSAVVGNSGFYFGPNGQLLRAFKFSNGTNSRVFDTVDRQPLLNNLNLQLIKNGPIGGKIELSFGNDTDVIPSWPTASYNKQGVITNNFDITNAYLSGSLGPVTLIVGKFSTLAGAEVIESPSNLNFSRSILFGYAVPFTHTGARLTFAPTSNVSLIGGINNGWDNTKGNGTGAKTAEGGLAYTNKNLTVTAQGYTGTEQTAYGYAKSIIDVNGIPNNYSGVLGRRNLIDAVATYKTGIMTFTANYDSGIQKNATLVNGLGTPTSVGTATWNGLAGYASAALTSKWSVTGRYEYFNDLGGYRTGYSQRWNEGTLTLGFAPSSSLLFRVEGRTDHSNQSPWTTKSLCAPGVLCPTNDLTSVAFESIVKF